MPAIIFDLDGVLIDSEALQYKAYSQVLARYAASVTVAEYAKHWIADGLGPEYAVERFHLPMAPEELRARKSDIYPEILRHEVTLMPGVPQALARLQPRFALGVATNSNRRDVDFVMQHFDLRHFFTAIVTRENYAEPKPAPDAFATAAAQLATSPQACLVVEDAHRGVLAAHRAGTVIVAIPNDFTRDNDFSLAKRVLSSMDELSIELVEELVGQPI
jgi:HAD superfamily hydrolase (TIGR01509 family)